MKLLQFLQSVQHLREKGNNMEEKLLDVKKYPLHMRGDITRRNENVTLGRTLCKRCDGTGNELYSMYKKCEDCDEKGHKE